VAAEALVEMLLERGCDGDLAVLWLRALVSQSRGEEAAYQDFGRALSKRW